jgi:hypothetical protein
VGLPVPTEREQEQIQHSSTFLLNLSPQEIDTTHLQGWEWPSLSIDSYTHLFWEQIDIARRNVLLAKNPLAQSIGNKWTIITLT